MIVIPLEREVRDKAKNRKMEKTEMGFMRKEMKIKIIR